MKTEFFEVLKEIRESSLSESEKGTRFEQLILQFFRTDPIYTEQFEWVKRWNDWEDKPNTDQGIDIVAEYKDREGLCAIQCKFYKEDSKISLKEIQPLIVESSKKIHTSSGTLEFTGRILVHTADHISKTVEEECKRHDPIVQIIDSVNLADKDISWPELTENINQCEYIGLKYEIRDDQEDAVKAVIQGLKDHNRGKMIMACGTGKTFTSLKIAERVAKEGGRVLYLVPSISLLQQTMREWVEQKSLRHKYIGICSDVKAGKADNNEDITELEIPVSTDPKKISRALGKDRPNAMQVVFCTYQSIDLVYQAQNAGAPEFDIAFIDEAHRTTGLEKFDTQDDELNSVFVRIHKSDYLKIKKRLYMTATPRVYAEGLKKKAEDRNYGVFSMDEERTYGPEFYRLDFSEAIDRDLLSDYKVVVMHVDEEYANRVLSDEKITEFIEGASVTLEDAAKMIGVAKAMAYPLSGVGASTGGGGG